MKITVLGLGIIGEAWAKNLQADGLTPAVWNRTPKSFPGFCSSAAEAADGADFIIIVVADPPAVEQVLRQIKPVLRSGQVVIQSSTISSQWTLQFSREVESTGARYLEAPFTGSKPAAEQRQTVFYLGGEPDLVERVRPVLSRLSKTILHIGPIGTASSLKLAMNMNIALIAEALSESLVFARQAGISDDTYFEALKANVSRSGVSDLKEPKLRKNDYSPQFSLKHMNKDLRLALESVGALELPLLRSVKKIYDAGIDAGWGDDDFSGLIRLLRNH